MLRICCTRYCSLADAYLDHHFVGMESMIVTICTSHLLTPLQFQHVFYRLPVLDRADTTNQSSMALCHAVCLMGSLLRRPRGPTPLAEGEAHYFKAKILLQMDYEKDPIKILKTICFLMVWTVTGPIIFTSNSPWYWHGTAIRTLQQIGLHREATFANYQRNVGSVRRLAWYIFVSIARSHPVNLVLSV